MLVPESLHAQDAEDTGKWQVSRTDDYVDILLPEDYTSRLFGIRCENKRLLAFVVWDEFVGTRPRVEYRIDKQVPKELVWNSGSDGKSSFFPPSRVIEFIRFLEGHETLAAKVTPVGKAPLRAEFDIRGIDAALAPIREACDLD